MTSNLLLSPELPTVVTGPPGLGSHLSSSTFLKGTLSDLYLPPIRAVLRDKLAWATKPMALDESREEYIKECRGCNSNCEYDKGRNWWSNDCQLVDDVFLIAKQEEAGPVHFRSATRTFCRPLLDLQQCLGSQSLTCLSLNSRASANRLLVLAASLVKVRTGDHGLVIRASGCQAPQRHPQSMWFYALDPWLCAECVLVSRLFRAMKIKAVSEYL